MRRTFLIAFTLLAVASIAAALPMCGLMFRCGCTVTAGERHCNIHNAAGPHCPWCEGRAAAFLPGYGFGMSAAGTAMFGLLRHRHRRHSGGGGGGGVRSLGIALLLGASVYFAGASLAALLTARVMHYPYWFGWRI